MSHPVTDYFEHRRCKVQAMLALDSLDAILVSSPCNVSYLTNFSGDSSYLILGRDRAVLVSDGRYTEQIAEECPGLETHVRPPSQPLQEAVAEALNKLPYRSVEFEAGQMSVAEHETLHGLTPAVAWKAGKDRVEQLRAVKDAFEIGQIRAAIQMAERAFAMFRAMLRPGDTEKELADALEMYVRRAGARGTSFPSIVAVGERAALPHAPPSERRVTEDDLLLIDWGANGRFYKSDLTRVLVPRNNSPFARSAAGQEFAAKLRPVYAAVLDARRRALAAVRPGVVAGAVDAEARGAIGEAGYGQFFNHGTGHGFGLQIHEMPFLKPGASVVLHAGMVITIEPGIYLPGWGGVRVEDDVLVTAEGCEVLSRLPRDLEALGLFEE